MADKARTWTDDQLREMEKHVESIYKEAQKGISEKWDKYMQNAEKRLRGLEKAYAEAKKSGDTEAIKKAGEKLGKAKANITYRNEYYKNMVDDTTTRLANTNKIALSYLNGELPQIYAVNYNEAAREADKVGVRFDLVNENMVKNLVTEKEIKLPYKDLDKIKDKRWNAKQINSSVLQGILQGESMDKIAARLTPIMDNNEKAAIRNARTMVTGAECRGRLDSYKSLEERGAVQKKVWIATPDSRVRDAHLDLDGVEIDLDDEFAKGLEYPGDTNADPALYYNCRCSMKTHIIGFRKADGRIEYIDYERQSTYHDQQIEEEREARGVTKETAKEEKANAPKLATTREEAYKVLTDNIGFHEVTKAISYIDDETIIAQANQLLNLNNKFKAIGDNYGGYISAENSKSFVATTRGGGFTNPNNQNLVLSFDSYAHGIDSIIAQQAKDTVSGWVMPALEENYGIYTITHEYGHIFENVILSKRIDIDAYNEGRYALGTNLEKLKKYKKKIEDTAAKEVFTEITDIAKENNPNFSLKANISAYGKSNYQEAFAETFANSQLGKPNELGKAMNIWLSKMGY